jgi:hypothetical protein
MFSVGNVQDVSRSIKGEYSASVAFSFLGYVSPVSLEPGLSHAETVLSVQEIRWHRNRSRSEGRRRWSNNASVLKDAPDGKPVLGNVRRLDRAQ